MKLLRIYENILREGKAEGCLAMFGKELFSDQLGGGEPNTELENDYLTLITQFRAYSHGSNHRPAFVEAMKRLKDCMSAYPEVLQPSGRVYRGEKISLEKLLHQFDEIEDHIKTGGEFHFNYQPDSIIQSWTSDRMVATNFVKPDQQFQSTINKFKSVKDDPEQLAQFIQNVKGGLKQIKAPIMLQLDYNKDEFLFKGEYFDKLTDGSDDAEGEYESLRIITNQHTTYQCYC